MEYYHSKLLQTDCFFEILQETARKPAAPFQDFQMKQRFNELRKFLIYSNMNNRTVQ